jgi:hypothetical protein
MASATPNEALIRKRTLKQLDEAIYALEHAPPGSNPAAQAEHFERLARLLSARAIFQRSIRRRLLVWPLCILFIASLVGVLALSHIGETEVDMRVLVTSASFTTTSAGQFTPPGSLARLTIQGSTTVDLPRADDRPETFEIDHAPLHVARSTNGQLNAQSFEFTAGSPIDVSFRPDRGILLYVGADGASFAATVFGSMHVMVGSINEDRKYVNATPLVAQSKRDVGVLIDMPDVPQCIVCRPVSISRVAFRESDTRPDDLAVLSSSAIDSGTVHFIEVALDYDLHHGERLRLTLSPKRISEVRQIRIDPKDNTIQVALHAWVTEVQAGTSSNRVNLMPTFLEWLRGRHGPEAAWATLAGLVAALETVRRWVGRSD